MSASAKQDLAAHLERYGIRHFDSDEYWVWGGQVLGPKRGRQLDRLRAPIVEGRADEKAVRRFYDYIADPVVGSVVHSMKTGGIIAAGTAVEAVIKGRRHLLDLGCHIGYLTTWYAAVDPNRFVTGVDISNKAIQESRRWAAQLGISNVRFEVADVRDEVPGEGYDAVIDTQTLGPNVARLGDALARIRAVLQPDGLFVSVPALGTAQEASVFLDALREAGFTLRRFEFTRFQDLGAQMAYPVIEADLSGGPGIGVDLEEIYTAMLLQLQSGV